MPKSIKADDVAEIRLIFDEGDEVPNEIELAGTTFSLVETERVCGGVENQVLADEPAQIHAFYMPR
jgi:hypothetical protein